MLPSTACARCRLRALIQTRSLTRQRRQCLSSTPLRRQEEQAGEYVDTLLKRFDKSLGQQHRPVGAQRKGRNNNFRRGDTTNGSTRGRYSGRPIQQHEDSNADPRDRQAARNQKGYYEHVPNSPGHESSQHLLEDLATPILRRETQHVDQNAEQTASMVEDEEHESSTESHDIPRTYLNHQSRSRLPPRTADAALSLINAKRRGDDLEAWESMQEILRTSRGTADLQHLGNDQFFHKTLFYWTIGVTEAFVNSSPSKSDASESLPTPAVAFNIRRAFTQSASSTWPSALWDLAKSAATLHQKGSAESQASSLRVIEELMLVWSLCMKTQHERGRQSSPPFSAEQLLKRPSVDFSFLLDPGALKQNAEQLGTSQSLEELLNYFVLPLSFSSHQRNSQYVSAALVTMDLLQNSAAAADPSYSRWTRLIETVLECASEKPLPRALAIVAADNKDEQMQAYFSGVIDKFELGTKPAEVQDEDTSADGKAPTEKQQLLQSLEPPPALTESSSEFDHFAADVCRKLHTALERGRLPQARSHWTNVQKMMAKYQSIQAPLWLYERLLVTFLALRDEQTAIDVWRAIVSAGHKPTVKTYSIAMQGCRFAGDASTLELFWANMRRAGLQPDSHAWSTRVFCQLKSRRSKLGLQVLNEMSQEWIAAARKAHDRESPSLARKKGATQVSPSVLAERYTDSVNGVPRPNIIVLNSALAALASANDAAIPKALNWGRAFSIEPDLITYNTLINISMRHEKPAEALDILRHMNTKGIQADSQTWTVLLSALFARGALDNLEPAEQQDKILAFIDSLESADTGGIDTKGYALIIDRLLKHHANPAAADAVLQHMLARGIEPTAHIYTILMSSYFDPSLSPSSPPNADPPPPNFAAIDALWNRIVETNQKVRTNTARGAIVLDAQFYDRMIEGYAHHHAAYGSSKPMMYFLLRAQHEGKRASWKALAAVVRALGERDEWERARSVVGKVMRDAQSGTGGASRSRFGMRYFWEVCVDMRLVGESEANLFLREEREARERGFGR